MALRSGASEAVRKLRDLLLSQLGQGILGAKGFQEVLQGCLKTIKGSIVRSLSRAFLVQAQHRKLLVAGPQQELVATLFSSNHRSRGLQLDGRAVSVTSNVPSASRGADAQYSAIGRFPSLTSKVSLAAGSSRTWSETFRMIAENLPAGIWPRPCSSISQSWMNISDQASGLAPQSSAENAPALTSVIW
jgi:hypothetical protein